MDLATIIGLVGGLAVVVVVMIMDGGTPADQVDVPRVDRRALHARAARLHRAQPRHRGHVRPTPRDATSAVRGAPVGYVGDDPLRPQDQHATRHRVAHRRGDL